MGIGTAFENYLTDIRVDAMSDFVKKFDRISNKLHEKYWDDKSHHGIIVGSVGRGTAIRGVSDLDMLYVLPNDVKKRFDAYKTDAQSKLLQEVKRQIDLTYNRTRKRGDGQVVVVSFTDHEIEVCPVFIKDDSTFYYPDANDGGRWRETKPLLEQSQCEKMTEDYGAVFIDLCHLTRAWKNQWGVKIGGLLIDTLVANFLLYNIKYKKCSSSEYPTIVKEFFAYLASLKKEQKHWEALGSRQHVYNKMNGQFITKAKKVHKRFENVDLTGRAGYKLFRIIFGSKFPKKEAEHKSLSESYLASVRKTEQFIEDLFSVDIRNYLHIDCDVEQNGFREFSIKKDSNLNRILMPNKSLVFKIIRHDVVPPYDVYWKIKNEGKEAERRDCIRGQIVKDDGNEVKKESTTFKGKHFVECYIIKSNVCVAKNRVIVPISMNAN